MGIQVGQRPQEQGLARARRPGDEDAGAALHAEAERPQGGALEFADLEQGHGNLTAVRAPDRGPGPPSSHRARATQNSEAISASIFLAVARSASAGAAVPRITRWMAPSSRYLRPANHAALRGSLRAVSSWP